MIESILKIFLMIVVFLIPLFLVLTFLKELVIFKMDKYNPYRRYCKKCGQRQEMYSSSFAKNYNWWEDMGQIFDEKCKCHKYSKEYEINHNIFR